MDNLSAELGSCEHEERVFRSFNDELLIFGLCRIEEGLAFLPCDGCEVNGHLHELLAARFVAEARELQQAFHEAAHALCFAVDDAGEMVAGIGVLEVIVEQGFGKA